MAIQIRRRKLLAALSGTAAWPLAGRAGTAGGQLFSWLAWSAPVWNAAMMQNLDLVDWILLGGAMVYFGLVVLRRI